MTKFHLRPTISFIFSIIFYSIGINVSIFKDSGFSCFNFFLFSNTRLESLRLLSFKITFLGEPSEGIRWQVSTKSVLTGASILPKLSSTFPLVLIPYFSRNTRDFEAFFSGVLLITVTFSF